MRNLFEKITARGRTPEEIERASIQRAWDRERSRAVTASQRQEIDAIFARHL